MNVLKKIVSILILILLIFSTLCTVISGIIGRLSDSDTFSEKILTAGFYQLANDAIRQSIESNSSIVDIDVNGAMEAIDETKVNEFINRYVITLTENIVNHSTEDFDATYNSSELYNYIRITFDSYADEIIEGGDYTSSVGYIDDAYDTLISDINGVLRFMPADYFHKGMNYIDSKVSELSNGKYTLSSVYSLLDKLDFVFLLTLVGSVLLIVIYLLINYKKIARAVFVLGSVLFFSSVAFFVTAVTTKVFDMSSKLCLDYSMLEKYVNSFINTIENAFFKGAFFYLGVSTLILIAGIVVWVITTKKNNRLIDEQNHRQELEQRIADGNPDNVQILL